jgi:hypothetical protein
VSQKKPVKTPIAKPEVPLSESIIPKIKEATAAEVIADLYAMAQADPDKVISRNHYRVHGKYAESAWNQHYGTFQEFKRQAGIVLTRQQHGLERAIAKHASVDHYRKMGEERASYGEDYLKPTGGRFKTIIVASDLHDEEMDPFFRRVLIDTIRRVQPDVFCLGGDGLDLPEFGKYTVDPREWAPVRRIRHMHEFCKDVRSVYAGQFDWLEGNHEFRALRHLSDETPALKTILAELHGFTIRKLFGLDQFEINYIAKADLAAYNERDIQTELGKNYQTYWDAFLVHHFPQGRQMGLPGVNGHHHRHVVWSNFSPIYGAHEWHQMGCGHKRDASYCNGEKWHMGFDIAHIDTWTRATSHDYVTVGDDFAVSGGQWYRREKNERVSPEWRIGLPIAA